MILSDAEIYKRGKWRSIPTMQDVARIQHAETLRQLEKNKKLIHYGFWKPIPAGEDEIEFEWHCYPECDMCAALREVGA